MEIPAEDIKKTQYIIDVVNDVTGMSKSRICSRDRHNDVAMVRFMVYYAMHYYNKFSFNRIARLLNRTHATVIYGVSVAETWNESNKFRDKSAKENGKLLKQIMDKLNDK